MTSVQAQMQRLDGWDNAERAANNLHCSSSENVPYEEKTNMYLYKQKKKKKKKKQHPNPRAWM
jgi:hypothetical protein